VALKRICAILPVLQRLGLADRELAADVAVLEIGLSCGEPETNKKRTLRNTLIPTGGFSKESQVNAQGISD
jgi:hypothetical protein